MNDGIFIGICVGSGVIFLIIITVGFKCARKRHKKSTIEFLPPTQALYQHDDDSQRGLAGYYEDQRQRAGYYDHRWAGHGYSADHDPRMPYNQAPYINPISRTVSSYADKSRSARGPESDSTFERTSDSPTYRRFFLNKIRKTGRNSSSLARNGDENSSLISNLSQRYRGISSDKIDNILLHSPIEGHETSPRPQDDMLVRRMSPVSKPAVKRRSKSVSEGVDSPRPDYRKSRSRSLRHGAPGHWETIRTSPLDTQRDMSKKRPFPEMSNTLESPRHHSHQGDVLCECWRCQDAHYSTYSTPRKTVKEVVDAIRRKSAFDSPAAEATVSEDFLYSPHSPNMVQGNAAHYRSPVDSPHYRSLSPMSSEHPVVEASPGTQVPYNKQKSHTPVAETRHYTPATPPSLPPPPKQAKLRTAPPVWSLAAPPTPGAQHDPPPGHQQSNGYDLHRPETPPLPLHQQDTDMCYTPLHPPIPPVKPVMMQTQVVPRSSLTQLPRSSCKPARPVIMHSHTTKASRRRVPVLSPKPAAKPVLLNPPIMSPRITPSPRSQTPSKPSTRPVLLNSPTSRALQPSPPVPSSPKPVAKPVLVPSPTPPPPERWPLDSLPPAYKPVARPVLMQPQSQLLPMPSPPASLHVLAMSNPPLPSIQRCPGSPQPSPPCQTFSPKYRTRITVSPRIQAATGSGATHKTVIGLSPNRGSIVSERAERFNGPPPPSPVYEAPLLSPVYFNFPPEHSPEQTSKKNRHVRIALSVQTNNATPQSEPAVDTFVDRVNDKVSPEELLSEDSSAYPVSMSGTENNQIMQNLDFTPGETSTPKASQNEVESERTNESLIQSHLWKRRQKMANSDTIMDTTNADETWTSDF